MSFKLNERINAPYVLGYTVHCSVPVEQFRTEGCLGHCNVLHVLDVLQTNHKCSLEFN